MGAVSGDARRDMIRLMPLQIPATVIDHGHHGRAFIGAGPAATHFAKSVTKTDDDTERQLVHTLAYAIVFIVSICYL